MITDGMWYSWRKTALTFPRREGEQPNASTDT